jgi:hypothetical protein
MRLALLAAWILTGVALADQPVEVRVFNASTGSGIPDFPVRFLQYGQTLYRGATDAAGRFRIEAAKEGPYTVVYERGKYWPAQESGLVGGSIALEVNGGAEPVRLEIGMYPMGKISGRVLDGAGKPVPKARIDLSDMTPPGGGWIFESDEKGEFSNEEVRPGTWTLSATAPPTLAPPESPADQPLGWAHTYYPSAASRELGAPIVVPPGAELRNLDIRLAAVPVHHVRGVVVDVSGNPVPKINVTLDSQEPPTLHRDSGSDGTFDLAQVVDGDCRFSATLDKGGVKLRAAQWVQVKGRDLENVELRLVAPFSIQARVVMEVPEGAPVPKTPGVSMRSADGFGGFDGILPGIGFFDGNPDGKGGFTIKNLYPAAYQIIPGTAPAPYYLDSIRFGARDALERSVQVFPGDLPLTIAYKSNGGTVRGTVDGCTAGASKTEVMLIPQDPVLRRDGFIHRTSCGQDGRFDIAAVRPGEYYGFAVGADNPAEQRLSGFGELHMGVDLDQNLINQSVRVKVRANEATEAEIRMIRR